MYKDELDPAVRLTTLTWNLVILSTVLELATILGRYLQLLFRALLTRGLAQHRRRGRLLGKWFAMQLWIYYNHQRSSLFQTVELDCGIEWPSSTWVTQHSSVHLPGERLYSTESECVHDRSQIQEVVQVPSILLVKITARCVEESLAISQQVHNPFRLNSRQSMKHT